MSKNPKLLVATIVMILLVALSGIVSVFILPYFAKTDNITVTNQTSNAATIVWTTQHAVIGKIEVAVSEDFQDIQTFYDDRDTSEVSVGNYKVNNQEKRQVHHVTIKHLQPETQYYFKIYNNNQEARVENSTFNTAAIPDYIQEPNPVYGKITDENNRAIDEGIVIYEKYSDNQKSQKLSAVINNGTYSIDGSNLMDANLEKVYNPQMYGQTLTILASHNGLYKREVSVDNGKDQPADTVILSRANNELADEYLVQITNDYAGQVEEYTESCTKDGKAGTKKVKKVCGPGSTAASGSGCTWGPGSEAGECIVSGQDEQKQEEEQQQPEEQDNTSGQPCTAVTGNPNSCQQNGKCEPLKEYDESGSDLVRGKGCKDDKGVVRRKRESNGSCGYEFVRCVEQFSQQTPTPSLTVKPNQSANQYEGQTDEYTEDCTKDGKSGKRKVKKVCGPGSTAASGSGCLWGDGGMIGECIINGQVEEKEEEQQQQTQTTASCGAPIRGTNRQVAHTCGDNNVCNKKGQTCGNYDCFACKCGNGMIKAGETCNFDFAEGSGTIEQEVSTPVVQCIYEGTVYAPTDEIKQVGPTGLCFKVTFNKTETNCLPAITRLEASECTGANVATSVGVSCNPNQCFDKESSRCLIMAEKYKYGDINPDDINKGIVSNGECNGRFIAASNSDGTCTQGTTRLKIPDENCKQEDIPGTCPPTQCFDTLTRKCVNADGNGDPTYAFLTAQGVCTSAYPHRIEDGTCVQGSYHAVDVKFCQENGTVNIQNESEILQPGQYKVDNQFVSTKEFIVTQAGEAVYFYDLNGNGIKDANEVSLTASDVTNLSIQFNKVAEVQSYNINVGWNLISFPINMRGDGTSNIQKASELLTQMNEAKIGATHVISYRGGKFVNFSRRNDDQGNPVTFGEDFSVMPGEGYFIKSTSANIFVVKGNKIQNGQEIILDNGWNLTSIYNSSKLTYGGFEILKQINSGGISTDLISKWENGTYQNLVLQNNTEYGNDYSVYPYSGYFVRVKDRGATGRFIPQ